MGSRRATQKGLEVVAVDARAEPADGARLGARGARQRGGGARRCLTPPRRRVPAPKPRASAKTAEAPVLGAGAGAGKTVKLSDAAFAARFNEPLVHQSVRAEQAARRRGTASTKTRGMVSGGGAKPWRQKGTGRARAGSSRSPIWTGGGTAFGPSRAPTRSRSTARSSALRCAARCRCTPSAAPSPCSTPRRSQRPRPARLRICSTLGPGHPARGQGVSGAGRAERLRARRGAVVPQPRTRGRADPRERRRRRPSRRGLAVDLAGRPRPADRACRRGDAPGAPASIKAATASKAAKASKAPSRSSRRGARRRRARD